MNEKFFGEFDWKEKDWGGVPKQRVIFEDTLRNIPQIKDRLPDLIKEGKILRGHARVISRQTGALASYSTQKAYQFTPKAEEDWQKVLENRINAFDYSELI